MSKVFDASAPGDSLLAGRRCALAVGAAALLAGCSGTRTLDLLVPRGTYKPQADMAYGRHRRHMLDAYLPTQQRASTPMVVFFYGGNWSTGNRADYRFVGEALASAGIVTVVADYRLSPEVRWQGILDDCAAATRWAFDNARSLGVAPDRVYLMGHSAGAYNAAMLALDAQWLARHDLRPSQLAGWIGLAGPYNFLPIVDPPTQVAFDWPNTPAASQPIHHTSVSSPRALLLAAKKDSVVSPTRNTLALAKRLEAAGASVRTELFDRASHVTLMGAFGTPLRWIAPVREEVIAFVGGQQ